MRRRTGVACSVVVMGVLCTFGGGRCVAGSIQPAVIGRIAYVPGRSLASAIETTGVAHFVYMKLPGKMSVELAVSHPLLVSGIGGLRWSPDASRLLFLAEIKGKHAFIPWILDLRSKSLKPLTKRRDGWFDGASWLSGGRRVLAWPQYDEHATDLLVIDLRTGKERTVCHSKSPYKYICSSSRDEIIVRRWAKCKNIYYLMSVDHGLRWQIDGFDRDEQSMLFSPDGRKIALYVNSKLYVIDCRTRVMELVYTNPDREGGELGEMVWSPDGKWIAVRDSHRYEEDPDHMFVDQGFATIAVSVDTKVIHSVSDELNRRGSNLLGWTKDSRNLVLSVPVDVPHPEDLAELVICPLSGGSCITEADIRYYPSETDWLPK